VPGGKSSWKLEAGTVKAAFVLMIVASKLLTKPRVELASEPSSR
jgi:hypothetical protein